jgi:cyclase
MKQHMSRALLAVLCAVLSCGVGFSQQDIPTGGPIPDVRGFNDKVNDPAEVAKIKVVVRHVAGQVYVIAGAGGNVYVFAGPDGVLLVDTNFKAFYEPIMAEIRRISDKPIRFVINTHAHSDHVENNANFAKQGAAIISTPNLREEMMRTPAGKGADAAGLPMVTSAGPLTLHFNGEEVDFIPLKPAHTDGDGAVYFRGSDVFAFGDVYRNDYPSMGESGTTQNFIDNYTMAINMTNPKTLFAPGHGQISPQQELIDIRDAVKTIHARFVDMVANGMTLDQIVKARPSKEFDAHFSSEALSPTTGNTVERWYGAMYKEATKGAKQ